jgi:excisionase family DNA binding protein
MTGTAARSLHLPREAVSMQDAADLLDVHYNTVRRLVRVGDLPAFRVGRQRRILRSALLAFQRTHLIGSARSS